MPLMEYKLKEFVAILEFGTMFVLCGNSALHTYIPNIAMFARQKHWMEVVTGKFPEVPVGVDMTRLEISMSFFYRSRLP
jgi:hypothetical protein